MRFKLPKKSVTVKMIQLFSEIWLREYKAVYKKVSKLLK